MYIACKQSHNVSLWVLSNAAPSSRLSLRCSPQLLVYQQQRYSARLAHQHGVLHRQGPGYAATSVGISKRLGRVAEECLCDEEHANNA